MIAMGRYLFKYAYASIVHNDRKMETNYGHVHEKNLETCR